MTSQISGPAVTQTVNLIHQKVVWESHIRQQFFVAFEVLFVGDIWTNMYTT